MTIIEIILKLKYHLPSDLKTFQKVEFITYILIKNIYVLDRRLVLI